MQSDYRENEIEKGARVGMEVGCVTDVSLVS